MCGEDSGECIARGTAKRGSEGNEVKGDEKKAKFVNSFLAKIYMSGCTEIEALYPWNMIKAASVSHRSGLVVCLIVKSLLMILMVVFSVLTCMEICNIFTRSDCKGYPKLTLPA
jgi:hypothetical protein